MLAPGNFGSSDGAWLGDKIGRLEVGAAADLCAVELREDREPMTDGRGEVRMGRRWRPVVTVKGGVRV